MFIAPKGHTLISWDLKQAESWVVAFMANEHSMKHSLANGDIHTDTAIGLYKCERAAVTKMMRDMGKKSNHALAYREGYLMFVMSVNKESDKPPYTVLTNREGKRIWDTWHTLYHLKNWWDQIEFELSKSRSLRTPYGRKRVFFAPWGNELFKEATAFIPQSTVADHLNGAIQPEVNIAGGLLEVHRQFVEKGACKVINQSHDSIIVECPSGLVSEITEPITKLLHRPIIIKGEECLIPVDVEIGERWGELEKVKRS
jgi:DNA polymerase I-like protein with 3'-5' exonuclease and polymerase domains